MSCHYFITLLKCFCLLNFSDINRLNSPFRAPSSFLLWEFFFGQFPFNDIDCQLLGEIDIVQNMLLSIISLYEAPSLKHL